MQIIFFKIIILFIYLFILSNPPPRTLNVQIVTSLIYQLDLHFRSQTTTQVTCLYLLFYSFVIILFISNLLVRFTFQILDYNIGYLSLFIILFFCNHFLNKIIFVEVVMVNHTTMVIIPLHFLLCSCNYENKVLRN